MTAEEIAAIRDRVQGALVAAGYDLPNLGYDEPNVITAEDNTAEFRLTITEL